MNQEQLLKEAELVGSMPKVKATVKGHPDHDIRQAGFKTFHCYTCILKRLKESKR